jgi:hypothetical protein
MCHINKKSGTSPNQTVKNINLPQKHKKFMSFLSVFEQILAKRNLFYQKLFFRQSGLFTLVPLTSGGSGFRSPGSWLTPFPRFTAPRF